MMPPPSPALKNNGVQGVQKQDEVHNSPRNMPASAPGHPPQQQQGPSQQQQQQQGPPGGPGPMGNPGMGLSGGTAPPTPVPQPPNGGQPVPTPASLLGGGLPGQPGELGGSDPFGVDFLSDLNFGTDLGPMPYISGDEYSTFSCQYARTTR